MNFAKFLIKPFFDGALPVAAYVVDKVAQKRTMLLFVLRKKRS